MQGTKHLPVGFSADNPLGTDGFEFVEFTAPDDAGIAALAQLFETLGFVRVAEHRHKAVSLYRQGDINFILNAERRSPFLGFARRHGPSACAMAWRVHDAPAAYRYALKHGAKPYRHPVGCMELNIPAIQGVGGTALYLVDRYGEESIYEVDFRWLPEVERRPAGCGLLRIDHLTHNVERGHMDPLADFYRQVAGFSQIRYFEIAGRETALRSRALGSPCGQIRIPINESADDKSQIEEFLHDYHGEGIQHIALSCTDIHASVAALSGQGVRFLDTPDTYYERLDARLPGHPADTARLAAQRILLDGSNAEGWLLQIFTETLIGPIFFELIERRGNPGFGEGNFQALFEAIEEDQRRRGVL